MFKSKKLSILLLSLGVALSSVLPVKAADYKVTSGDSLYTLSKTFNTTITQLKTTNNLTSDKIYIGQTLNVPAQIYSVKSGDSLYLISKKFGITLGQLRVMNNKWDDYIYPSQKLLVPGTATTSSSSASTASNQQAGVIPYSQADVDLLARLINAEAQGEPYSAKVAVGAVIINRVQDSRFPKTISSVIYQVDHGYYQFTPVLNGWIDRPASSESIQAAYEALRGSDPSNGALYYFDDSTTNTWLWSKPIAARISHMVFAY